MTVTLTSPITGSAQTGFTSPTYTHVADTAPDVNAKQVAVTALGGTQTGATVHSLSSPFQLAFWKPKVPKVLGKPHPVTGLIANVPLNVHKCVTRKGVTVASGQPYRNCLITTVIEVPAGADTYDSANVKAALSAHLGSLAQVSAGLGDTVLSGVL